MVDAHDLKHPFDNSSNVSDDLKRNIFLLLTEGWREVKSRREKCFEHYERRLVDLQASERRLHGEMPKHREALVADKNMLLFAEMCRDAGVDDEGLVQLQALGTPLYGESGSSNLFEQEPSDSVPAIN